MAAGVSADSRNIALPVAASSAVASPSTSAPSNCVTHADLLIQRSQLILDMDGGRALVQSAVEALEKARQIFKNTGDQFSVLAHQFEEEENIAIKKAAESLAKALPISQDPNQPGGAGISADRELHQPKDAANDEHQQKSAIVEESTDFYLEQANTAQKAREPCLMGMEMCAKHVQGLSKFLEE